MTIYIFFREEGWYPLTLRDDSDAILNAEQNPGTLKVENLNGELIWKKE